MLGMSLSSMFEVTDAFDLLKGLLNILSEYEQIKDDPIDKSKIVRGVIFSRGGVPSSLTLRSLSGYSGLNSTRSKGWVTTPCPTQTRRKRPI